MYVDTYRRGKDNAVYAQIALNSGSFEFAFCSYMYSVESLLKVLFNKTNEVEFVGGRVSAAILDKVGTTSMSSKYVNEMRKLMDDKTVMVPDDTLKEHCVNLKALTSELMTVISTIDVTSQSKAKVDPAKSVLIHSGNLLGKNK